MDAIAKLHAVSQCRQLKQAARPLKLRCARQIDRATLDSRPHAAPKIRDTSVTAEVFEHHKREAVCGQAPTLRLAGSVQKYLMSATLPQFLESNRPTNAARLPMQFVAARSADWPESARFTSNLRLTAESQRDSLPEAV
jgi:hypothetical protein